MANTIAVIACNSSLCGSERAVIQACTSLTGTLSLLASLSILLLPLVAQGPSQTFQYLIIAVLACFNVVESLMYVIGPALTVDIDGPAATTGSCALQGVILQFSSMAAFGWILVFCYSLFQTTRGGSDVLGRPASVKKVAPQLAAVIVFSLLSCAGLSGSYGDATLWCWTHDSALGLLWYYCPLMIIWALSVACVTYACYKVRQRADVVNAEIKQRHDSSAAAPEAFTAVGRSSTRGSTQSYRVVDDLQRRAVRQLSAYLVVFVSFSTFGLANRIAQAAGSGDSPFWLFVLQALSMPLQGFANGMVFAAWVRENWRPRWRAGPTQLREVSMVELSLQPTTPGSSPGLGPAVAFEGMSEASAPAARRAESHAATLFAATWNLGEADPPDGVGGALRAWLPSDRDVYVIGFQECLSPQAWCKALHAALDGTRTYVLAGERMIGSTKTALGFHGYIVLYVFVASELDASGAFAPVKSGKNNLHRGKNLAGVARAPNKGAVALAFRFHASTIAIVSCHLAADSKGKVHVSKRLDDTRRLLQDLHLEIDSFDADLHHTHRLVSARLVSPPRLPTPTPHPAIL